MPNQSVITSTLKDIVKVLNTNGEAEATRDDGYRMVGIGAQREPRPVDDYGKGRTGIDWAGMMRLVGKSKWDLTNGRV